MSNYLIVSEVGDCLRQTLGDGFEIGPVNQWIVNREQILLQSPHGLAENQLSVFLYRIVEDPHTKNQPPG